MWPWRLKKLPKRTIFVLKLSLISCFLHAVFFFALITIQIGKRQQLRFSLNSLPSPDTPVIFLPLYKRIHKNMNNVTTAMKQIAEPVSAQAAEKPQKKQAEKPIAKKESVKPVIKTTVLPEAKKEKKEAVKKLPEKKKIAHNSKKKSDKSEPVKKTETVQKIEKKEEDSVPAAAPLLENEGQAEPVFIGRQELALLQMQAVLEQEISTVWKPPRGLSKDLSCEIVAIIGKQGKVIKTIVQKPSGVLLYDVAARTALAQVNMPAWAHGKEVCITFKQ